ncbi:MAG: maltotransferase domain-containing protein [Acidimicrobiales bacterium]
MTPEATRPSPRARPRPPKVPARLTAPHTGLAHLVVQDVRPSTPHGYPAKAVVGEAVPVRANIFRDGHDVLAARAVLRKDGQVVSTAALAQVGNDEWAGALTAREVGAHELVVEAWTDRYATWAHKAALKLAARQDVGVEIAEAVELLSELEGDGQEADGQGGADSAVAAALAALRDEAADHARRVNPALSAPVAHALAGPRLAADLTAAPPAPVWVDRERAGFAAWYELFPRSFGGLRGAAGQVPRLAGLGFDVLYLPPVHPIGHTFRKGKDNSAVAGPGDPGSPWAIGSEEGGHTALHPELGSLDDFDHLVRVAYEHGMEVALDYALQCSPDHPWVKEHPEWFHHRPDGTIAYAENPPKKYQDIYPLNFWPPEDADRVALWEACKGIFDFWADRGVRTFRVDNPHTKPFAFWEWVLSAVRAEHPDVVFLAEAFTRPKVMARLAEVGFTQSYTYFTWRTSQYGPEGVRTYVEELAHGPLADYMRPSFWPNTPDILSGPLRGGPPSAFALRYVLAATLAPLYGVYGGYELYENEPTSPDNEEYRDSEKYELKHRDFSRPGSLSPLFAAVNRIRRRHPAFARLRPTRFHDGDNPNVVAYSKASDDGTDVVLVVVSLDPWATQETTLHLDLSALGVADNAPFEVFDELSGETYTWGPHPYVKLDPYRRVAHICQVRRPAWAAHDPAGPWHAGSGGARA